MQRLLISLFLSIPLIGAFVMFALGISVIYRASRVLNLAHGAMAMVPAYVFYTLVARWGLPMLVGLPLAVACGAGLGVAVERVFVRRLRSQGPTAQTVGTVAVAGLLISLAAKVWGTTPILAPTVFPVGELRLGGAAVRYGDLGLFAVGVTAAIGLFLFFRLTEVGLALRGAAQNRRAAALMGIDPDLAASGAWALGGALAALAGVLLAAVTNLDPYNLSLQVLPAFVAVLLGGMESLLGAAWGSAVVGLTFGLIPILRQAPLVGGVFAYPGAPQLLLTLVALGVMAARGRRFATAEREEAGLSGGRSSSTRKPRRLTRRAVVGAVVLLVWPWVVPFSVLGDSLHAMQLGLVAVSLVVLIGWVGQISLAQAGFVGIAALITAMVARGWGLGFPVDVLVGAVAAGVAAVLLGLVALRVRGLYLAVATLIFAWMADQFLFRSPWLGMGTGSSTIPNQQLGLPGGFPYFDFTSRRTLYFVMLAVVVVVLAAMANIRDTRTGRALFAIRGSEVAAASLGIDVMRYKLAGFALSGVLAGIGGGLLMIEVGTVVPAQFLFTVSLQYLAVAVVGGLTSLAGAMAAAGLFAALDEVFFRVAALAGWLEVVSAGLLAAVLLAYPGGLAALPGTVAAVRARLGPRLAGRARPAAAPVEGPAGPKDGERAASARPATQVPSAGNPDRARRAIVELVGTEPRRDALPANRFQREALLLAKDVRVQFGGLVAVEDVTLSVREREVVGLIGPNGAGKTTLFNAILGLVEPSGGSVRLYGRDATRLPPHDRAALGVARTFQVIQLFNELTVFDNLLVATHLQHRSGVFSNLVAARRTLSAEAAARKRAGAVLDLLGLAEFGDRPVRGLPFGVLRMVELGRALVTGSSLLMLDEPVSGLNDAETDRFIRVIRQVRALGLSVLLIEHDVRMVTAVSDYVYVLDQGHLIAKGLPANVQRHPGVVAAYLGTTGDAAAPAAAARVETPAGVATD